MTPRRRRRRTDRIQERPTVRIGLTGPIGCGKSTIAGWLGELGGVVIDADQVARDVVEPGTPELDAVLATFGDAVRAPGGRLDRAALGRIVFADPDALRRLEAITHPAVRARILAAMDAAERDGAIGVVVEAIKLVESGLGELCDEVWLVRCGVADQRARLAGRGLEPGEIEGRINAQSGLEARAGTVATSVIDTGGSLEAARAQAVEAWRRAVGEG